MAVVEIEHTSGAAGDFLTTYQLPLVATPQVGDVVIVRLTHVRSNVEFITVAGLGATWDKVAGTPDDSEGEEQQFWLGTGATTAGTVTATADGSTWAAGSITLVRGLTSTTVAVAHLENTAQGTDLGPALTAGRGQYIMATAYSGSMTVYPATAIPQVPVLGWVSDAIVTTALDADSGETRRIPTEPPTSHQVNATNADTTVGWHTLLVLGDPVNEEITPQRFYFWSSGTSPAAPAYGALWDVTNTAARLPLMPIRGDTALQNQGTNETVAGADGLVRQYVSEPLARGTVPAASFTLVNRPYDNNTDSYFQATIRLISNDGSVERAVLYGGQTATSESTNPGDPNYELPAYGNEIRVITGTLASASAQEGDRIVVELGVRFTSGTASGTAGLVQIGDPHTHNDLPAAVDAPVTGVAWIEFDREIVHRRRFYFPSAGTPAAEPEFGSLWGETNDVLRVPLVEIGGLTPVATNTVTETSATLIDVLAWQYISDRTFSGGLVNPGNMRMVTRASQDGLAAAFLQVVVRVVSNDGLVERGVFFAGQTETVVDGADETANNATLTGTLASPRTRNISVVCDPVMTEPGDRLVVELGARATNTSADVQSVAVTSGSTDTLDLTNVGANYTSPYRSWIEFDNPIFLDSLPFWRNLAINPSGEQNYNRAWVASNGTVETNVTWEV